MDTGRQPLGGVHTQGPGLAAARTNRMRSASLTERPRGEDDVERPPLAPPFSMATVYWFSREQ
jgi:hypothetical protein